jgi:uncharacterized membrane protein YraQ (UPF0718 family)
VDVGTVLLIGLLLGYVALTMIIALVGPRVRWVILGVVAVVALICGIVVGFLSRFGNGV